MTDSAATVFSSKKHFVKQTDSATDPASLASGKTLTCRALITDTTTPQPIKGFSASAIALAGLLACGLLGISWPALADNQSPSIVNGIFSSEQTGTSVRIGWNRPWDDIGVDGYNIYRNNSYVSTVFETSFLDNNLQPGNTYEYQIAAFDAARNYSSLSPAITVQTSGANNGGTPQVQTNSIQNDSSNAQASNQIPALPANVPVDVRGTEVGQGTVRWEWAWVPGAAQYEVTVDGLWAGVTSDTSFFSRDLWAGEHSVSVKSISNGNYSQRSHTAKITVSSAYNPANANRSYLDGIEQPPQQIATATIAPPAPQQQAQQQTQAQDFGPDNGLVDPQTRANPDAQKDGFQLVFSDEFNGQAINSARWNTNFRWDGEFNGERYEYRVINNEDQFYVSPLSEDWEHRELIQNIPNPFEFNGSRLAIRAQRNPLKTNNNRASFGPLREIAAQQTFISGALSSHTKFAQKYGYFEARIKIPSHEGTFPAFWLYHNRRRTEGTRRSEIDIMENLGHAPWYVYNTFHYFDNVSPTYGGDANFLRPEPSGQIYTGEDFSQNFHVYAVKWEPGHIEWLIDGQKVSELWHGAVDYEELYVLLNLALGGNWTNFPTSAGGLGRDQNNRWPNNNDANTFSNPALEIDYVRVYRRN